MKYLASAADIAITLLILPFAVLVYVVLLFLPDKRAHSGGIGCLRCSRDPRLVKGRPPSEWWDIVERDVRK